MVQKQSKIQTLGRELAFLNPPAACKPVRLSYAVHDEGLTVLIDVEMHHPPPRDLEKTGRALFVVAVG